MRVSTWTLRAKTRALRAHQNLRYTTNVDLGEDGIASLPGSVASKIQKILTTEVFRPKTLGLYAATERVGQSFSFWYRKTPLDETIRMNQTRSL